MNKVSMLVNSNIYSGWTSASITRSIKAVAGSFAVTLSNNWTAQKKGWIISPLDETKIEIDGNSIINGFVDKISSGFDSKGRTITISGRDKTADLVDCSYVGPSTINNVTLEKFINKVISPFGLSFVAEVALPAKTENFSSQQGETCFAFLERMLKIRGFLLTSDTDGNLKISQIGKSRSSTSLEEGVNCERADFDFDATDRFSDYYVKGQSKGSDETDAELETQVEAHFKDPNVQRFRPLIIIAETGVSKQSALDRAKWEAITRSAKSSVLKVSVKGWRKQDSSLWLPNEIVNFKSKYFGFDIDLLITDVTYSQSATDGTKCTLTLENKDAYKSNSEPKKGRDVWKELNPQ